MNVLEMKCLRSLVEVSFDRVQNEVVRRRAGLEIELLLLLLLLLKKVGSVRL